MFIGHYTASFIAKGIEPRAPLGLLFIAAQFLDFVFFPLVLLNIEVLEMHQNATASTHFMLPFMPWSHSFWAMTIWSMAVFIIALWALKTTKTTAFLLALVTQSHWLFDLIVHEPDLAIWNIFSADAVSVGFGLWNHAMVAFILECGLLTGSVCFYLKRTYPTRQTGRYGPILFLGSLILIQASMTFGPYIEMSNSAFAATGLALFIAFTLIATHLDAYRRGGNHNEP